MEGRPNVYSIHSRGDTRQTEAELSGEEWDKLERDVADAFERIP